MSKSSSAGASNGSLRGAASSGAAPAPGSRDHLKIEKDGNLVNRAVAPELPSRPQNGGRPGSSEFPHMNGHSGEQEGHSEVTPSKEQYERIVKYQQEIKQHRVEKEARRREEEFLRSSLRQSDRLKSLENTLSSNRASLLAGVSNAGYSSMGERGEEAGPGLSPTTYTQITEAISRLKLSLPKSSLDTLFCLEDLVRTSEFRLGLDVCNKLQAAWSSSSSSQPPVSCEAQELAEDCLSLSDGGAQTGLELEPAAKELAAILRKESLEGLLYVHDKLAERHALLNSFGEEDVILDRVSHYAEPNIKVVKLEKTNDPLGATVKNEGEALVVGRIIKGGVADRWEESN